MPRFRWVSPHDAYSPYDNDDPRSDEEIEQDEQQRVNYEEMVILEMEDQDYIDVLRFF